jgi:hypothetical protein
LFGFQVSVVLTDRFEHLDGAAIGVHLGSLMLIVIAIVMLIAPAAYHRIAVGGETNEAMLNYTVRMMLPSEALIALGLVGDVYVTVEMISASQALAITLSLTALTAFISLLYVLPALRVAGGDPSRATAFQRWRSGHILVRLSPRMHHFT